MNELNEFLPFALPDITEAEIDAVVSTMRSGWLTTGPTTSAFEGEFAEYLGSDVHAVAVNSATAGLHLAIEALGIGPGDEVLVPTWTFTATAEVVRYVGAVPILVDVNADTLNIDFAHAEALTTSRTRAVIPVHFAGLPVNSNDLINFTKPRGLEIVEDAAHAFPVMSGHQLVGAGDSAATVFSFYATKTMCTGEGGMLVTPREDIAKRARVMRLHGISRDVFGRYSSRKPSWQYDVVAPGFKYNMTDVAAAMGRVQLARAEDMRLARHSIAERYHVGFSDLPVTLPTRSKGPRGHAHHLFVLRIDPSAQITRDHFINEMARLGIGTSVHFIPLHQQPYWRQTYDLHDEDFPVASQIFQNVVSLPIFSAMTVSQVDRVIDCTRQVLTHESGALPL